MDTSNISYWSEVNWGLSSKGNSNSGQTVPSLHNTNERSVAVLIYALKCMSSYYCYLLPCWQNCFPVKMLAGTMKLCFYISLKCCLCTAWIMPPVRSVHSCFKIRAEVGKLMESSTQLPAMEKRCGSRTGSFTWGVPVKSTRTGSHATSLPHADCSLGSAPWSVCWARGRGRYQDRRQRLCGCRQEYGFSIQTSGDRNVPHLNQISLANRQCDMIFVCSSTILALPQMFFKIMSTFFQRVP